jgi:hypothetical protein
LSTGRLIPGRWGTGPFAPVPAPGIDDDTADMLIGEVRKDHAERNRKARNPDVLQPVIIRFRGAGRDHGECAA